MRLSSLYLLHLHMYMGAKEKTEGYLCNLILRAEPSQFAVWVVRQLGKSTRNDFIQSQIMMDHVA